jgi:hypothetical protein
MRKNSKSKTEDIDADLVRLARRLTSEELIQLSDELIRRAKAFRAFSCEPYRRIALSNPIKNLFN